jgi:hypothetical protein
MVALRTCLPYNIAFGQVHSHIADAYRQIEILRSSLPKPGGIQKPEDKPVLWSENAARDWVDKVVEVLQHADTNATTLVTKYTQITARAEQYLNEMDFKFLYHSQRRVFHIGFNLVTGQLDQNYYDL